ncbi:tyrosine-type recombinase/integrase [Ahrensia kielensis]|uniref:tyrosine-type recombinase/integrase n=1 Tax=Ahrensia kielensis TaxID=76980 RepID=UPI000364F6E3|nr:site-specific integrase [Ahrensia kielensis]
MSVRKRTWSNAKAEEKTAWVVDYADASGKRRLKSFKLKKDADKFAATASIEVREGRHVAERDSATVSQAAQLWLAAGDAAGLERSTANQYQQHVRLHIEPLIGALNLSKLSIPIVRQFEDDLATQGRSQAMVRKVMVSFGSILADAQERGLVARNVVRDMRSTRRRKSSHDTASRHKSRLRAGIDIPHPHEIKALVGVLSGVWKPILITAIFTGMRSSELRGLTWSDVDLNKSKITVSKRADRYNQIGSPKSLAGQRTIPLPPMVVEVLSEWKERCPAGSLALVFPTGAGNIESLTNIRRRGLIPAWEKAGIVDDKGEAKYTGLHALRHFYASWCINRPEDGGLGLPAKVVQERLGHSTIAMTLDVYGHLFPSNDNGGELAKAQAALLG